MSITAAEFQQVLEEAVIGNPERYLHPRNQELTFTSGLFKAVKQVNGRWLVDLVAAKVAPLYAKASLEGSASVGIVILEVFAPGEHSEAARVTLSLEAGKPPAFSEMVDVCDFPEGTWTFYLSTDSAKRGGKHITNLYLPQEH